MPSKTGPIKDRYRHAVEAVVAARLVPPRKRRLPHLKQHLQRDGVVGREEAAFFFFLPAVLHFTVRPGRPCSATCPGQLLCVMPAIILAVRFMAGRGTSPQRLCFVFSCRHGMHSMGGGHGGRALSPALSSPQSAILHDGPQGQVGQGWKGWQSAPQGARCGSGAATGPAGSGLGGLEPSATHHAHRSGAGGLGRGAGGQAGEAVPRQTLMTGAAVLGHPWIASYGLEMHAACPVAQCPVAATPPPPPPLRSPASSWGELAPPALVACLRARTCRLGSCFCRRR